MSRFFSSKYKSLKAYVPGEQPRDKKYIKLNTNESPYPPSEAVTKAVEKEIGLLQLYSDPETKALNAAIASLWGLKAEQIVSTNGSDEALNFVFMTFCDKDHPIAFPDLTYGFYSVFAQLNDVKYKEIPLKDDFSIDYKDYCGIGMNVVIANPNAPTGLVMPLWQIEEIVKTNPDNVVVIDEAYIDYGGQSATSLIDKYDNLIVIQTFSKSRSMAGARLGFAASNTELIKDLNTIRFSTNPYNVNRMTAACGIAAIEDNGYYMDNVKKIINTRGIVKAELEKLGFEVLESHTNFVFARTDRIEGEKLYLGLKDRGVLVRYFSKERIKDYNRITIGTPEEMERFIEAVKDVLGE
ncbi:MAG: histidinol-phosphate transaminase [Clostridia bacterium]|nr:histidinol-phosphate transaminase [Clostridia bacterium]